LTRVEQAKLFSKEEEKTTKKKKKVLCIAGRGKNARLFRFFFKKVD
jgi:predicted DNA-binding ribbon-helix-helix protein